MIVTQKVWHEKSSDWETGYCWHVQTFVDGQLRSEAFQGAKRRTPQYEGVKLASEALEALPEVIEKRARMQSEENEKG